MFIIQTIIKSFRNESVFIKLHFSGELKRDISNSNIDNILDISFLAYSKYNNIIEYIIYLKSIFCDYEQEFFSINILNNETGLYVDFLKGDLRTYIKSIDKLEIRIYRDITQKIAFNISNIDLSLDNLASKQLSTILDGEFKNFSLLSQNIKEQNLDSSLILTK